METRRRMQTASPVSLNRLATNHRAHGAMSDFEENIDLDDAYGSESDGYKPAAKKVRVAVLPHDAS